MEGEGIKMQVAEGGDGKHEHGAWSMEGPSTNSHRNGQSGVLHLRPDLFLYACLHRVVR